MTSAEDQDSARPPADEVPDIIDFIRSSGNEGGEVVDLDLDGHAMDKEAERFSIDVLLQCALHEPPARAISALMLLRRTGEPIDAAGRRLLAAVGGRPTPLVPVAGRSPEGGTFSEVLSVRNEARRLFALNAEATGEDVAVLRDWVAKPLDEPITTTLASNSRDYVARTTGRLEADAAGGDTHPIAAQTPPVWPTDQSGWDALEASEDAHERAAAFLTNPSATSEVVERVVAFFAKTPNPELAGSLTDAAAYLAKERWPRLEVVDVIPYFAAALQRNVGIEAAREQLSPILDSLLARIDETRRNECREKAEIARQWLDEPNMILLDALGGAPD